MDGLPIGLVRSLALASPEEDEPAGPCDVCNNPESRPLYVEVCEKAGGTDVAKSGIVKLCAAISPAPDGAATLLAIGDVLVTWTPSQLNAFFSDITAPQAVSAPQHVTNHVGELHEGMVRAWGVARRAGLEPEIRSNVGNLDKIASYQAVTSKSSDDIVEEIEGSAITSAGSTRSWLDNIPSGGGLQTGTHGDYVIRESAEIFYRGLSESDYQHLLNTGQLRFTSETFTSPSLEYIQAVGYGGNGRIVKFYANLGTLGALESIGVRNDTTTKMMSYFPNMPHVTTVTGWTQSRAMFKTEGSTLAPPIGPDGQINIGLGRGAAINIFNQNLQAFEVVQ